MWISSCFVRLFESFREIEGSWNVQRCRRRMHKIRKLFEEGELKVGQDHEKASKVSGDFEANASSGFESFTNWKCQQFENWTKDEDRKSYIASSYFSMIIYLAFNPLNTAVVKSQWIEILVNYNCGRKAIVRRNYRPFCFMITLLYQ